MKSIDRYMARLIAVPLISTLLISAMLLVLDRMLRCSISSPPKAGRSAWCGGCSPTCFPNISASAFRSA
jgi:hypothetical protein